ncbi:Hypothetical predicted protein [Paramuricea clavata]|uniref:Uncharacterized protein n=1 Tax=Paramuricea clavata TaxID=317549 RepID=A0A6S7G8L7_PARCT|nr:Hypothetical predicted protein [Paramuricea clavata]
MEKHNKAMKLAEASFEEISTSVEMEDLGDIESGCELVQRGKNKIEKVSGFEIKIKRAVSKDTSGSRRAILKKEIEKQHAINEENERARRREKDEMEELAVRWIPRELEWLLRKLEIEKEAKKQLQENTWPTTATQIVKLQKYTITPFTGDFIDWTRFLNQFSVELDNSSISEISKFNYLLELTKEKPREEILGLPHTSDGYIEAK